VPDGYTAGTCRIVLGPDFMGLADARDFTVPCFDVGFRVNGGNGPFFDEVTAGGHHTCGLTADGTPWCWGRAEYGQTGAPASETCAIESLGFAIPPQNTDCSTTPALVSGGLKFQSIDAGGAHTCALDARGRAYCWGANPSGEDVCTILYQRGTTDRPCSRAPVLVSDSLTFIQLSTGLEGRSCGVTPTDNAIYCWTGFGPAASPPGRLAEPAPRP
jgi:alpha-tubulin suppressor-like RCC1 family protein